MAEAFNCALSPSPLEASSKTPVEYPGVQFNIHLGSRVGIRVGFRDKLRGKLQYWG